MLLRLPESAQELNGLGVLRALKDVGGCALLTDDAVRHVDYMVDTSRAKAISWVTTSIVSPSLASWRMTASTRPPSGGPARRSARQTAVPRAAWPARGQSPHAASARRKAGAAWHGYRGHADLLQIVQCGALGGFLVHVQHIAQARRAVVQHRHIVEKVKALEHHAHLGAVGARVAALAVMSLPWNSTLPFVGVSSRLMQRSRVDLPLPDAPMMQVTSPGLTVNPHRGRTTWCRSSWRGGVPQ